MSARSLSITFIEDVCMASAREHLGPQASDSDVRARAHTIYLFLMGYMITPSRAVH